MFSLIKLALFHISVGALFHVYTHKYFHVSVHVASPQPGHTSDLHHYPDNL